MTYDLLPEVRQALERADQEDDDRERFTLPTPRKPRKAAPKAVTATEDALLPPVPPLRERLAAKRKAERKVEAA